MDFAPPPQRDNFQTEDEYNKAKEKWQREFNRALKNMGLSLRVSQHDRLTAITKFGVNLCNI